MNEVYFYNIQQGKWVTSTTGYIPDTAPKFPIPDPARNNRLISEKDCSTLWFYDLFRSAYTSVHWPTEERKEVHFPIIPINRLPSRDVNNTASYYRAHFEHNTILDGISWIYTAKLPTRRANNESLDRDTRCRALEKLIKTNARMHIILAVAFNYYEPKKFGMTTTVY